MKPTVIKRGGSYYLDLSSVARLLFEMDSTALGQIGSPTRRLEIIAYQNKVRAYIGEMQVQTGTAPAPQEAIERVCDMKAACERMRQGDAEGAVGILLHGASAS